MAIFGVLKTIFNLITALPTLLKFIREVQAEITRIKIERETRQILEEMEQNAKALKQAQADQDEEKQRDALSRIVDNYNRK